MKIVAIIARILLGLMFFVFGLNPFLKFLRCLAGRSVGTVSRRAGRFTLCVVCGCGAGHQRSAVSDWEVRPLAIALSGQWSPT